MVQLAISTASSASRNFSAQSTGPKISSCAIFMSGFTAEKMVGLTKKPLALAPSMSRRGRCHAIYLGPRLPAQHLGQSLHFCSDLHGRGVDDAGGRPHALARFPGLRDALAHRGHHPLERTPLHLERITYRPAALTGSTCGSSLKLRGCP